jgi:c(7)-type cytochrome triheme protein
MRYFTLLALAVIVAISASSFATRVSAEEGVTFPKDIVYSSTGEAVVFSHRKHVEDFGTACDECHGAIFAVKVGAARAKGDFTMQSLYSGKYCGVCHNGQKAFASDDIEQCARCHSGSQGAEPGSGPAGLSGPKEPISLGSGDNVAVFKHPAHGALSCDRCHTDLFPMKKTATITTMDDINAKKSCGTCHNGATAFDATDCGKCHPKM